jgi:hypothetical protein
MNAMCYKTKEPVYYNKGTKYEKTHDTFLSYYASCDDTIAYAEAERLNREKPEKDERGYAIDWNKIDYFFINKQELFED